MLSFRENTNLSLETIVTRKYERLLKVYYLKAVQILELDGYKSSITITGTTLKVVIILKHLSQQLPSERQMIALPPNDTILLVKEVDTLSKIIPTETSCSQRHSNLLSQFPTGKLPVLTDSKASGVNENHTFEGPDCEGSKQLDKL